MAGQEHGRTIPLADFPACLSLHAHERDGTPTAKFDKLTLLLKAMGAAIADVPPFAELSVPQIGHADAACAASARRRKRN
jgi:hypothetical protein